MEYSYPPRAALLEGTGFGCGSIEYHMPLEGVISTPFLA